MFSYETRGNAGLGNVNAENAERGIRVPLRNAERGMRNAESGNVNAEFGNVNAGLGNAPKEFARSGQLDL